MCYNETACFVVMISIPKCLFLENWVINKLLCILHAFFVYLWGLMYCRLWLEVKEFPHTTSLLMVSNDQIVHLILNWITFFFKPPIVWEQEKKEFQLRQPLSAGVFMFPPVTLCRVLFLFCSEPGYLWRIKILK